MVTNQRYIPLYKNTKNDELTGQFLVVIDHNNPNPEMRNGYERVLTARLDDAAFFWSLMQNRTVEELIELTKNVQSEYNPSLSAYKFINKLTQKIQDYIFETNITTQLLRTVSCDTGTEIICEFPALRGIIASKFLQGEKKNEKKENEFLNEKNRSQNILYACNFYYGESELYEPERNLFLPVVGSELEKDSLENCRIIIFFKHLLKLEYYLLEKNENPTSSKDPFGLYNSAFILLKIALYPQNLEAYAENLRYPSENQLSVRTKSLP